MSEGRLEGSLISPLRLDSGGSLGQAAFERTQATTLVCHGAYRSANLVEQAECCAED
jgi:hypothetical protein